MFNNLNIFEDLLDLFEESTANERNIIDVIGNDVSRFCDEFISAYVNDSKTRAEKLNKEIRERFYICNMAIIRKAILNYSFYF